MDIITSLANIAKDTIARKNPFPALEGLPSNMYGCKWGLTDLYPEDERILRDAINSRKTFDTGWISCKKEIRSFRMISDGTLLTVQASADMDDFDDLIYDGKESNGDFTKEEIDDLYSLWAESDMDTSICTEQTVLLTTYENAMQILSNLEDSNEKQLNAWFNVVKEWVNNY